MIFLTNFDVENYRLRSIEVPIRDFLKKDTGRLDQFKSDTLETVAKRRQKWNKKVEKLLTNFADSPTSEMRNKVHESGNKKFYL